MAYSGMIKVRQILESLVANAKLIIAVGTICTSFFTWGLLRINTIKINAVREYVEDQDRARKDTTIVFLSKQLGRINSRLRDIEGLVNLTNVVMNEHTSQLTNIKTSLRDHYIKTLTKEGLINALEELESKKNGISEYRIPYYLKR
jgi:hypothetical protein